LAICDQIGVPTPGYEQRADNLDVTAKGDQCDLASPTWRRRRHGETYEVVLTPCDQSGGDKWRAK